MGRKEDLEQNICESYQLIQQYEEIVRLSGDPKEKVRAQRAITEQRELIRDWEGEYRQLGGQVVPDTPAKPPPVPPPIIPLAIKPETAPQKPIPRLGYVLVGLLVVDFFIILAMGWRFLRNQPELLSYLQVVTGFVVLGLEILLIGIVLQQKMSVADVLRWLGTSRLWQGTIVIVTIGLWTVFLWPQISLMSNQAISPQPASSPGVEVNSALPVTLPVSPLPTPTSWPGPCRIESFVAEPPPPQPVGSLVVFKIRGTCESGVRAVRLLINDSWYDEKGGHVPPAEEFVPAWSTKDLKPGDYKITTEIATWKDDAWEFSAKQTLTYTLSAQTPSGGGATDATVTPWFGPISFCREIDDDNRCISPTHNFPSGTRLFYASWEFQDIPLGTSFRRIWYRNDNHLETKESIWNNENWNSPTGVEYTYYHYENGFLDGEYTLEFYLAEGKEPIQKASFRIGP